ncbi:quinone oxidoreductase [Aspergillus similis]
MRAITVSEYGPESNLQSQEVPDPEQPQGRDLLIRVKACSVNPVDVKVRAGRYDDYPDYYSLAPRPYQICGFDGAGEVIAVGPECSLFSIGDEVFYSGSPIRQGSNAELQLVDERAVGHKPKSLTMVQAAAMPLTYITAYEALVERLEIKKGEDAAVLIINGAGGVGAVASQIARHLLKLPVVITTASRTETVQFSKEMGATHVINHHGDMLKQIQELELNLPVKYIFIAHSTDRHLGACAKICAPFGRVCSIVQGQARMYGTEFMAKSLSFIWALLSTKSVYGVDQITHHEILEELARLVDSSVIKCHLTQQLDLDLAGLREAHRLVEGGGVRGKVALGIPKSEDFRPFT